MNKRNIHDFFLYLVVGGIATLVEWVLFYCFNHVFSWYYIVSTILAYVLSTFANWLAGRILLFKKTEKGLFYEIGGIRCIKNKFYDFKNYSYRIGVHMELCD